MFDLIFLVLFFAFIIASVAVPVFLNVGTVAGLQAIGLCVATLMALMALVVVLSKAADAWADWRWRREHRSYERQALDRIRRRLAREEANPSPVDRGIV